jgi:hypothetical protein
MYADHRLCLWPLEKSLSQPLYSYDVDDLIERIAVRDLISKRLNRHHLLASDIYCRSRLYKPIPLLPTPNQYRSYNTRPILPRPISPVEFPRINYHHYQPPIYKKNYHDYDFSHLNLYNREPSFFPLAQNYYRLQTDYENFHIKKAFSRKRMDLKKRWKIYGFILIFYFMLKKNLRLAKKKDTYYQRDYHRLRFLELLTAVHRVYLEPDSPIYKSLSHIVNSSSKVLNQENFFSSIKTIINQITNFLPNDGILGTNNDESVLIYLLNCSLEEYPSTYFWSIERHLLSISYSKMKEYGFLQLDHFTTKFLLISTFIFHCLIKTLLLKPVKYRLIRGQLNNIQWSNTRLLSTLILYIARHAVIYKEQKARLPMPFPFEMKNYLIDDEKLKKTFNNIDQLVDLTAPKISAWACEYGERLQRHVRTMKTRS